MLDRREFLKASVGAVVVGAATGCDSAPEQRWGPDAYRKEPESRVAVLRADSYESNLEDTILSGLRLFSLDIRDKRVVLKPNLVEFDPNGVINTHPILLGSTISAFLSLGAREVIVAEGPGHRRDNEYLLGASGFSAMLGDVGSRYIDLNHDAVRRVELQTRFTPFGHLYLPQTILDADLLVSMPKLKTHHWAGVTLSLKNMFGVVPGSIYGWPKNVLHWPGIENSILDINAALQVPRFNIVDGIIGMEGNGPIQGDQVHTGVIVMGPDPVAVDATSARIMGIDPWKIDYIRQASDFLGNAGPEEIIQVGEELSGFRNDFRVLEQHQNTKILP